jgi:hypothetical protein
MAPICEETFVVDRRVLLRIMSAAAMMPIKAVSQQAGTPLLKRVRTSILEIAYPEH